MYHVGHQDSDTRTTSTCCRRHIQDTDKCFCHEVSQKSSTSKAKDAMLCETLSWCAFPTHHKCSGQGHVHFTMVSLVAIILFLQPQHNTRPTSVWLSRPRRTKDCRIMIRHTAVYPTNGRRWDFYLLLPRLGMLWYASMCLRALSLGCNRHYRRCWEIFWDRMRCIYLCWNSWLSYTTWVSRTRVVQLTYSRR